MFLSLSPFGNMPFQTPMIPRQSYSIVDFVGAGVFDGTHAKNTEWTNDQILAIPDQELLGIDSIWCANYNNNLQAGSYTSLINPIYSYKIQKRKTNISIFSDLTTILASSGITTYKDFSSKNYQEYEYAIYPIDFYGTIGDSVKFKGTHDFFGWFLSDLYNTICYKFDLNIQSDNIVNNEDVKVYDNYTEYAVTSYGKRKYASGKLTTLPYYLSGTDLETYNVDVYNLDQIKAFINNGQKKILRNPLGEIWLVNTKTFSHKYIDSLSEQPYEISFDFLQAGEV